MWPRGDIFFIQGFNMIEVKPHLTYAEQIKKLKSRGCIIQDEKLCETVLANIGYYRLSAYFLPFKTSDGCYMSGTSFDTIYNIYEFDRKLRNLIFSQIEIIEVRLRSSLSYFHSEKYGPLGYLDASTFNEKHDAVKFKENIDREIENNKKVLFVKHHIDKYDGQFPLWVISELFTFGSLSYFYNDMKTVDKKEFAGPRHNAMISWLRCCTDLRNICAHYGRLYFRVFSAMPAGFDNISDAKKRRLWGALLSVKELFPSSEKWNREFIPQIKKLFDEYNNYINLHHIAFPENWLEQLQK